MNKTKLLNQLIDLIEDIEINAFYCGEQYRESIKEYYKCNKKLAKTKTKAFKIIDLLIKKEMKWKKLKFLTCFLELEDSH